MNQTAHQVPRSTRDRILDAAERLFAEHGFADTSLRMITAEAGANLAAVNYYFQSKDILIQEVFARRLGPLNQKRLQMLDACEREAGQGPLPLSGVLRAFVDPPIRMTLSDPEVGISAGRLFGRMYMQPGGLFGQVFQVQFGRIKERFMAAMRRALPGLAEEEMLWRIHFMIGSLAHTMAGREHLTFLSDGRCEATDADALIARLVTFLEAGLRAPAAQTQRGGTACE
jgi:AcrR family transcriptional regulator